MLYVTSTVPRYKHIWVFTGGTGRNPLALVLKTKRAMRRGGLPIFDINSFVAEVDLEIENDAITFDSAVRLCQRWVSVARSPSHARKLQREADYKHEIDSPDL